MLRCVYCGEFDSDDVCVAAMHDDETLLVCDSLDCIEQAEEEIRQAPMLVAMDACDRKLGYRRSPHRTTFTLDGVRDAFLTLMVRNG